MPLTPPPGHSSAAPAPAPARALALALTLAVLSGCAAPGPGLPEPPAGPQAEILRERYDADLSACQAYAGQINVVQETLDGMVQGALIAAALVWGAGHNSDVTRNWAVAGGVLGGTQGLNALERRRQVVISCMSGRGQTLRALPVAPPAEPTAPPPAPWMAPRPTGTDGFNAERLARTQSCSAQPLATLVAKGPGFETYSVPCDNGDALALRCEFGNCRVLR
ncbi:MAG: glycine zipper family protein [Comamonadaceae bacterium]|nr:MAG: glycine zipper family protein [Comamonadaceae bacterium]